MAHKFHIMIKGDDLGNIMQLDNVTNKDSGYTIGIVDLFIGNQVGHLREPIHYHKDEIYSSLFEYEPKDEIHTKVIPNCGRKW